jgi:hypothetical protein
MIAPLKVLRNGNVNITQRRRDRREPKYRTHANAARMRSPREASLGPDGLQRLFTVSGVLSADAVRENLI